MTAIKTSAAVPSLSMIAAYGFLALPLAFAGLPLYIHVPDFYTRDMGLSIASAGIILMSLRLLDAVQDPLIGYLCDKGAGYQKAIMATGISLLFIGMGALLFGPPPSVSVAYWFAGGVGVTALGLSMSNINLMTIGSLWTDNDTTRMRASGMREGMSLVGMLLASVLPGILFLLMPRAEAFESFFIIFSVLLLAGSLLFTRFYTRLPDNHEIFTRKSEGISSRLPLKFFIKNKGFLSACFLTHIAASFPAVLFLYFVTDYLGAGEKAGLFLFLYFLSGAAFMPLWLRIARKYSAEHAWLLSMVAAISAFIWAFSLNHGDLWQFGVICAMSGAALGADLALPPVMMAQRLKAQTGASYATQAYAILNLIPKIALALGTGCAFIMLDQVKFSPLSANTPEALWTLVFLYALIPCLIKAFSAFIIFQLAKGTTYDIQKRSSNNGHTHGA